MQELASEFCDRLMACGASPLPTPDVPPHEGSLYWHNRLFRSAVFRRAHVELFEVPARFAVVHVCVLPQLGDCAPIFGFDMVAGSAQATGIFLDFSPVTPAAPIPALGDIISPAMRARYLEPRSPPAWGHVFSADFFAIRPADAAEIAAALTLARDSLGYYLMHLRGGAVADPDIVAGQAVYACAQRQNPHTVRMLARYVGAAAARSFVDEVLFPLPQMVD